MAGRRHGHGGGGHGGGGGHHGVPNYGVVKGRPAEERVFPPHNPSDQPHLHIKIDGGGVFFDVAVNILSQDNSEVLFRVDSHFSPARAADLLALPDGATTIGSDDPNGLGLDYLRQHLTTRDALMLLPIDEDNLDTDLHDSLSDLVQSVIDDPDATLFAFGSQFHDNNESPFWHFSPDAGIHDIHMNQGNPPGNHDQDNGTYQDGGLLAFFPSTGQWSAVFIAFQSQEFTNVNDQGNRSLARGASRMVVVRPRPLVLASPADFHARFDSLQMAHIQGTLNRIPEPRRDPPVMSLDEVIGAADVAAIAESGQIVFHSVGDTGKGEHSAETDVASAMAADFDKPNPADHPAFFFHLGDVIYGHDKDVLYREQFYTPYSQYPGRIVAIPGNHDGETFASTDPESCRAFLDNFCADTATIPEIAGSAMRETMTQPGVYFLLEAPFIRIIGLYSNSAENPGFISSPKIGDAQKQFLVDQLKGIARKRTAGDTSALVIATHHPPYSGGGHSGSREMLADIEDAIKQAGAAHRHGPLGTFPQLPEVHAPIYAQRTGHRDTVHRRRRRRTWAHALEARRGQRPGRHAARGTVGRRVVTPVFQWIWLSQYHGDIARPRRRIPRGPQRRPRPGAAARSRRGQPEDKAHPFRDPSADPSRLGRAQGAPLRRRRRPVTADPTTSGGPTRTT